MLPGQGVSRLRPRNFRLAEKRERKWQIRALKRERMDFPPVYTSKIFDTWFARTLSPFEEGERGVARKFCDKRVVAEKRKERLAHRRIGSSRRWRDAVAEKHIKRGRRKIGDGRNGEERKPELEETRWQITKFVLFFGKHFFGHESSRLLNSKEKISLYSNTIMRINMMLQG